jgi:hypothetical protein
MAKASQPADRKISVAETRFQRSKRNTISKTESLPKEAGSVTSSPEDWQ